MLKEITVISFFNKLQDGDRSILRGLFNGFRCTTKDNDRSNNNQQKEIWMKYTQLVMMLLTIILTRSECRKNKVPGCVMFVTFAPLSEKESFAANASKLPAINT